MVSKILEIELAIDRYLTQFRRGYRAADLYFDNMVEHVKQEMRKPIYGYQHETISLEDIAEAVEQRIARKPININTAKKIRVANPKHETEVKCKLPKELTPLEVDVLKFMVEETNRLVETSIMDSVKELSGKFSKHYEHLSAETLGRILKKLGIKTIRPNNRTHPIASIKKLKKLKKKYKVTGRFTV